MKRILLLFSAIVLLVLLGFRLWQQQTKSIIGKDERMVSLLIDPSLSTLAMHWKDENGNRIGSIANLKKHVESNNKELRLAMNGGMFLKDFTSQGLFIENGKELQPLDTTTVGYGNFYLQPNGIFSLSNENVADVSTTNDFLSAHIKYATQSGPMLVIDGALHEAFNEGSNNLHIRNGVGVLKDGRVLFAMSKSEINFFDFASYFRDAGCINALYLDGFVSRIFLPEEDWEQLDGDFGVLISVSE